MKSRRMFKKPLALLAAVVMAYALLPALSAAAAPPASATLANNSVFPGPGPVSYTHLTLPTIYSV